MKIEISIEKDGKEKKDGEMSAELMDEQKVAIGKKLQKDMTLTRLERRLLADYLLKEKED